MEMADSFPQSFDRRVVGEVGERLGAGLATCGDLDGDGSAELLVRAEWADVGGQLSGALSLLSASEFESAQRSSLRLLEGLSLADGGALGKGMVCDQSLGSLDVIPEVIAGAPFASNGACPALAPERARGVPPGRGKPRSGSRPVRRSKRRS
jgi:hypothetical protein